MARISARGKIVRIQSNDDMQKHSAESAECPAEAQVTSPYFSNSRESIANSRRVRWRRLSLSQLLWGEAVQESGKSAQDARACTDCPQRGTNGSRRIERELR